jgi:shikimate kinase
MIATAPIDRVVLLGFTASGKSTVGAALARRLEWRFVDFDIEIERREGRRIAEVVESVGDAGLRSREADLTADLADVRRVVLAPGGGWITNPALLASLGPGTFSVWLFASAAETVRRVRADPMDHPIRDRTDAIPFIERMLAEREPLYRLADLTVPVDGRSVETIAFEVEQVVRGRGIR